MRLKKFFAALLALALILCLCGCQQEEENVSKVVYYDSLLVLEDAAYALWRHVYQTSAGNTKTQYQLTAFAEDGGENESVKVFPTGVSVRFQSSENRCVWVEDGKLLAYTIPDGETITLCEVPGEAAVAETTEHYVLLSDQTLADLQTGSVRAPAAFPAESRQVWDVLEDRLYYWHSASGTVRCYDCADGTDTVLYTRPELPSSVIKAGKVWGDHFLYAESYPGLYAIPLTGEDTRVREPLIPLTTSVLAMARAGEDLYLAAQCVNGIAFSRLTPDGALTEVAVWEGFNASSPWSCGLYLAGDELVCAYADVTGPFEGPTLFRFPIPEEGTPAEAPVPEEPLRIEATPQEGVAPQAEYDLPEEVFEGIPDGDETCLKLAAYPDNNLDIYSVCEPDKNDCLLVTWENISRQFDISTLGTGGIAVHSALWDVDGDGADELILIEHAGSGTGVSVDNLHIVERTESGLSLYSLRDDAVVPPIREWITQRINMEDRKIRVAGTAFSVPDHIGLSDFALGNIVSFEMEDSQICMRVVIGFWPPEREFHGVSDYAVCLQADVVFSDGTFTLQNFTASERS